MKVELIAYTPNPEKTVAAAAKLCYAKVSADELYDGLTNETSAKFVEHLATLGHESPIEHVTFTFTIMGVSRAFLAQITRHRLASYSVQSQRYVKKDKLEVIVPPAIENNEEARIVFETAIKNDLDAYNKITDILYKKYLNEYLKNGIVEKAAESAAEKKSIEDARFVLPNACDTQMIVTMNARSLYNFFKHRCCNRAQWEIKAVADEMLRLVCEVAPTLFKTAGPSCAFKACTEGSMSCKKQKEMQEYYKNLHLAAEKKHQEKVATNG